MFEGRNREKTDMARKKIDLSALVTMAKLHEYFESLSHSQYSPDFAMLFTQRHAPLEDIW